MKLERKIELIKQSYLDGYAADIDRIAIGLIGGAFDDEGFTVGDEAISRVYASYQRIKDHYDEIVPFFEITQEMGSED